jgi:hypothetical protein
MEGWKGGRAKSEAVHVEKLAASLLVVRHLLKYRAVLDDPTTLAFDCLKY